MYNWNNSDIEACLNEIMIKIDEETDPKKISYCLKVVNATKAMLDMEKIDTIRKTNRQESMYSLSSNYYYYERFYKLIEKFNSSIDEDRFDMICNIIKKTSIMPRVDYLTDDDAVLIMHDFFKNTDKEIFKFFLKLYKNRYKSIKFLFNDKSFGSCDGSCIYIDVVKKNFILVRDVCGLLKVVNLAHECGHAIASLYNPLAIYSAQDDFLSELPSIFFELAFNYEVGRTMDSLESSLISFETLRNYSNVSNDLMHHANLINAWKNQGYKINKQFYSDLKGIGMTKSDVDVSMNEAVTESGIYIIGYMISLELLSIYKQDKKSALEILRKMIKLSHKDSLEVILKYIGKFDNLKNEINDIENNINLEFTKVLKIV